MTDAKSLAEKYAEKIWGTEALYDDARRVALTHHLAGFKAAIKCDEVLRMRLALSDIAEFGYTLTRALEAMEAFKAFDALAEIRACQERFK